MSISIFPEMLPGYLLNGCTQDDENFCAAFFYVPATIFIFRNYTGKAYLVPEMAIFNSFSHFKRLFTDAGEKCLAAKRFLLSSRIQRL